MPMPSRLPALVTQSLARCGDATRFTPQDPATVEPPDCFCEAER